MNNIEKLVSEITIEAMRATQQGKAFVFVDYYANVNGLTVYAESTGTDYSDGERDVDYVFGSAADTVYLKWDGAEEKLEDILTKIKGL